MVYFILNPTTNLIKIGYSLYPGRRLDELSTAAGCKLETVLLLEGGRDVERQLHDQFKDLRVHGEWFHCTHPIQNYIEEHAPDSTAKVTLPKGGPSPSQARQTIQASVQTVRRYQKLVEKNRMTMGQLLHMSIDLLEAHFQRNPCKEPVIPERTVYLMGAEITLKEAIRKYGKFNAEIVLQRLDGEQMEPEDALGMAPVYNRWSKALRAKKLGAHA